MSIPYLKNKSGMIKKHITAGTGKVFDFNATLPLMLAQLLILMVFLDKTWFGPVGELLDRRDKLLKVKISQISIKNDKIREILHTANEIVQKERSKQKEVVLQSRLRNKKRYIAAIHQEQIRVQGDLKRTVDSMAQERYIHCECMVKEVYTLSNVILSRVLPPNFSI
jgi:F-type H+-transporting ATPase subunit b